MNEVENLIIYKQYVELVYYTELITEKYPKVEKSGLVSTIKTTTYDGLKNILKAYKAYDKRQKIECLNFLDVNLKMIKFFARLSYKRKYISIKNYKAWSKKLTNIGNLLGGWMKACQKS